MLSLRLRQSVRSHVAQTSVRHQGNHTTFTSSVVRGPGRRDLLCALFHLSPEKYVEMMIELHEKTLSGEIPVQVSFCPVVGSKQLWV